MDVRRELTQIAFDLTDVGYRLCRIYRYLEEQQQQQQEDNDVIYIKTELKRKATWDGHTLRVKRRRRSRPCPICNANFGCSHL